MSGAGVEGFSRADRTGGSRPPRARKPFRLSGEPALAPSQRPPAELRVRLRGRGSVFPWPGGEIKLFALCGCDAAGAPPNGAH